MKNPLKIHVTYFYYFRCIM